MWLQMGVAVYTLKYIQKGSELKEMDDVSVSVEDNRIIITKAMPTSIKELFEAYPEADNQEEIDWGEPQGEEIPHYISRCRMG